VGLTARAAAKAAGEVRYNTGAQCRNGHIADRFTSTGQCVACLAEFKRENRSKYAETSRAGARRYYHENRNAVLGKIKQKHEADPEPRRKRAREYRAANLETVSARLARWRKENPGRVLEHCAFRRAARRNATPPWLTDEDRAAIAAIYAEARRISQETGIPHHVDHIVPLRGRNICGLHVPGNLQVIPANDNLSKWNKWGEA